MVGSYEPVSELMFKPWAPQGGTTRQLRCFTVGIGLRQGFVALGGATSKGGAFS